MIKRPLDLDAVQAFIRIAELGSFTRAAEELQKLQKAYPNFKPKLFLHKTAGALFHLKTLWSNRKMEAASSSPGRATSHWVA
jgi:hypothetical protein